MMAKASVRSKVGIMATSFDMGQNHEIMKLVQMLAGPHARALWKTQNECGSAGFVPDFRKRKVRTMIKFPFTDSGSKGTVTHYSRSSSWYQIPEITRDVDTFFVYPTDYMAMNEGDPDFAPLDNPDMLEGVKFDHFALASVYEDCTNLFIPYYRQAGMKYAGKVAGKTGDPRTAFATTPYDDITAALDYYFEHYNAGRPFIIAGQSYGGLLTRGFVNKYPDMIKKIILLVPCIIPGEKQGRVEPHTVIEQDDDLLSSLAKEERDSFTLMNVVLTKEVWERYQEYLMPALDSADWDFLNNVLEGSFSFDPDDLKEPCLIPCLIIAAKQDTEVGYKDQFDLMEKYINSTYCAVERAGHNLQIEQPEIFVNLVKNWLLTH